MTSKSEYLRDHQRTICPGCKEWLLWYRDASGKKVFGCQLGLIPEMRDGQWYCCSLRSKRSEVKKEIQ